MHDRDTKFADGNASSKVQKKKGIKFCYSVHWLAKKWHFLIVYEMKIDPGEFLILESKALNVIGTCDNWAILSFCRVERRFAHLFMKRGHVRQEKPISLLLNEAPNELWIPCLCSNYSCMHGIRRGMNTNEAYGQHFTHNDSVSACLNLYLCLTTFFRFDNSRRNNHQCWFIQNHREFPFFKDIS